MRTNLGDRNKIPPSPQKYSLRINNDYVGIVEGGGKKEVNVYV